MPYADLPLLPARPVDSHKGMFGRAMLIGGATGMTGAIAIAGMACLRSGVGLLTLAVPEPSQPVVATFDPCYMTLPLPSDGDGLLSSAAFHPILAKTKNLNCLAIGPGLGRSMDSDSIVVRLYEQFLAPMVVDADALNSLSESELWRKLLNSNGNEATSHTSNSASARILTPHPGEWERLSGVPASNRMEQIEAAKRLASLAQCVVVLKGHRTVVTDGNSSYENSTGNPSMAVGGSGDCLTGIITALVCQGLSGFDAAKLGVFLHGLAGDFAHQELGTPSSLATDIIRLLPKAFRHLRASQAQIK